MEGLSCDQQGGWTRIKFFKMTKPGSTYPERLMSTDEPSHQLWSKMMEVVVV